jgi:eukaryotic-like serine/threonine-protein kinase
VNQSSPKQTCPECGLEFSTANGGGCPGCSLRLALSPAGAPNSAPTPSLPAGLKSRFFGDYELLEEIGRGGMGVVYRARQLGLNRFVALKMVQSNHLLSDEARLRFRVEIEAVAQLNHPHIVSLYESGEQDGAHYFTMRLVDGGDLATQLKKDQPLRERVQLLVKVCRAVHYAHQRGILHRDLKPSNILVDTQGEPHIADFGLAKSLEHDGGFTFTSSVLGSPNYMAPEQATGKARQLTTAVDVYGLGAILYHMLAGRPPFQAKTPIETLRQVVDRDAVAPRSLNPDADRDLETIALKCLRKEPAARYGTAEDVAQDLERWLAGDPILARPLSALEGALRWSRRHPAAAVLSVALLLALAAIVIGTGVAAVRIRRAEEKAATHLRESLLREASSLRLGSELGHRDDGLRIIREAVALGGPPEFRMRARNELLATIARMEPKFLAAQATNLNAKPELNAVHTAFQMIASVEDETNVVFRALDDGAFRSRIVSLDGPITRLEMFGRNGRFLALRHGQALSVWDLKSGERCFTRSGTNLTFAFHPREDVIAIEENPYEVVWLELPSGDERLRWKAPEARLRGSRAGWHTLAFSPNGQVLAGLAGNTRLLEFVDAITGEQVRLITNGSAPVAISWSPSGNAFAIATDDGRVTIWHPGTGALQWSSPAMIASAYSLAFHPHRDWLAAACRDGKVRFIDTYQQRFVLEFAAESRRVAFSPHGTRLGPVWSEGQLGWLESRRAAFIAFGAGRASDRLKGGAFSADGKVLTAGNSDKVMFCDPRLGRWVTTRNDWRMWACAFHPEENYLLASERTGILRYAYRLGDVRITLSPPRLIHPGGQWHSFAFTSDGGRFAAFNSQSNTIFVFDETLTNQLAALSSDTSADTLAVSPDGRWLTTGTSSNLVVRLWDVSKGKPILSMPAHDPPGGTFSDDGRWLAVSGQRFNLLRVGTWDSAPLSFREKRPILGAATFSPDSDMLAVVVNRSEVHLFDLQTLNSLGILRPPGAIQMLSLVFSRDGSQLAGIGAEGRVAVWNMREVRQSLEEFGLGWNR